MKFVKRDNRPDPSRFDYEGLQEFLRNSGPPAPKEEKACSCDLCRLPSCEEGRLYWERWLLKGGG